MSRCTKCEGCINLWDIYRPTWCHNQECPEGEENPGLAILRAALKKLALNKKT